MVDVGDKPATERVAIAEGRVVMRPETVALIRSGDAKKGDVLGTARIAGIMAAKRTHELIPLCHPIALTQVAVDLTLDDALPGVVVRAEAKTVGATGVEMEALTAAAVACLTVYDMAKAADRGMRIEAVRLIEKRGGKSGHVARRGRRDHERRAADAGRGSAGAPARRRPRTARRRDRSARRSLRPHVGARRRGAARAAAIRQFGDGRLRAARRRRGARASAAERRRRSPPPAIRSPARCGPARRRASSPARRCPRAPTRWRCRRSPQRDGAAVTLRPTDRGRASTCADAASTSTPARSCSAPGDA